ncbi:WD40-repeat-containing domain protein [Baffinella frigidus]|nr:WD40-repeat-containing domain protein [Cryptophyta sp. CCMP2293]
MKHAPIPLPPLMLAHILSRLRVSSVQFQQWAMLRSIQKYYFPDNFASSQLWIKIHTFVMARDLSGKKYYFPDNFAASLLWIKIHTFVMSRHLSGKVNKAGAAAGLNLVSEAMKNSTTRNAEEVFHSRLARFFKEREMASMNPRALWSGRYPRALSELAYHMSLSRSWSQLEELLLDLRFIEGKFRQRLGHDLLQDFVLAAKAPEAAKWGKWGDAHKRIQDVHRFIAQNFELLQTDSSQCFQLAANHADSSSLAGIALHHWQTGRVRQVWSRWLNKPVEVDPQILVMYGHTAPITRVRFSSDGLRIISGSLDASKVHFSSDGLRIISGSLDASVRVWDAFSGEIIATVRAHLLPVLAVGFIPGHSAQDERGAVNSAGRVLCLAIAQWTEYEEGTGDPIQKTYVATGSWDRSCKIWDLDSGSLLHELGGKPDRNTCPNSEGHENAVTDCCFSPDGSVLATGSDDETLRLWNLFTGEEIKTLRLWNLFTGEEIKVLEGHDNGITSVDYAANGEYILTASLDATLKLWDVSSESGGTRSYFDKKLNTWVNVRVEMATFIGNQDAVYEGRISRDLQVTP